MKRKEFKSMLVMALKEAREEGGDRLRSVVEALVVKAAAGDVQAIREIADRLDGKPVQEVTGEDGGAIQINVTVGGNDSQPALPGAGPVPSIPEQG